VAAPRRYFDLREEILAAEQSAPRSRDVAEEVLAAVEDSVRLHMVADVPVSAFSLLHPGGCPSYRDNRTLLL
jgi:asparagine synthetase B (glutamine-hydrolysing)